MRLLIAGGGTGGHLFPGVAVAEELRARDAESQVLFVGTARGIEARVLPKLGWPLSLIEVSGLKTVGRLGALKGLFRLPKAYAQSRAVLKEFRPDAVLGVGGYASGPVVLAAARMGIPTAILEQNSIPGLTNKWLGRFVRAVFLAFEETRPFFRDEKIQMVGCPIRIDLRRGLERVRPEWNGTPRVLCFGGSQGAHAVNEIMVQAAKILHDQGRAFSLVHQTGTADLPAMQAAYAAIPFAADVREFIMDMASLYLETDIVVSRSGAMTIAEITAAGLPAILVPYPTAADNHQEINAREVAAKGGALVFRQDAFDGATLGKTLADLMDDPAALGRLRSAMKSLGRPDAAARVVDWLTAQTVS